MKEKIIPDIRAFNRFYTDMIGLLDHHILNSRYSLPEARIIYEIYHHENCHAKYIGEVLSLDKGQLSRILKKLEKEKIVSKKRSERDGRSVHLALTEKGRKEFEKLDQASDRQIERILSSLPDRKKRALISHMKEIMKILQQ